MKKQAPKGVPTSTSPGRQRKPCRSEEVFAESTAKSGDIILSGACYEDMGREPETRAPYVTEVEVHRAVDQVRPHRHIFC